MMTTSIPDPLQVVAAAVQNGDSPSGHTTRDLLSWFGVQRRGRLVNNSIRNALRRAKLRTEPKFDHAYLGAALTFFPLETQQIETQQEQTGDRDTGVVAEGSTILTASALDDPTYRIGKLDSANQQPVTVGPQATVREAITLMLLHDYSQLPVMQGTRTIKGAVTWQSIGRHLALGLQCNTVSDCLEEATDISTDTSLFAAIPQIVAKQFVLVRDSTSLVTGIVTTTDLSLQFRQLAEPFLLLGEIENHLRRLSDGKFTLEEVASLKDPVDDARTITSLADLTFGEHIRLLENPARWDALGIQIDRATFVKYLDDVREIRNDVMHFDPDGVAPDALTSLRNFVRLLVYLGVPSDGEP